MTKAEKLELKTILSFGAGIITVMIHMKLQDASSILYLLTATFGVMGIYYGYNFDEQRKRDKKSRPIKRNLYI